MPWNVDLVSDAVNRMCKWVAIGGLWQWQQHQIYRSVAGVHTCMHAYVECSGDVDISGLKHSFSGYLTVFERHSMQLASRRTVMAASACMSPRLAVQLQNASRVRVSNRNLPTDFADDIPA